MKQLHGWVVGNCCGISSFIEHKTFDLIYKSRRFCSLFIPWGMASIQTPSITMTWVIESRKLANKIEWHCIFIERISLAVNSCLCFPRQVWKEFVAAPKQQIGSEEENMRFIQSESSKTHVSNSKPAVQPSGGTLKMPSHRQTGTRLPRPTAYAKAIEFGRLERHSCRSQRSNSGRRARIVTLRFTTVIFLNLYKNNQKSFTKRLVPSCR